MMPRPLSLAQATASSICCMPFVTNGPVSDVSSTPSTTHHLVQNASQYSITHKITRFWQITAFSKAHLCRFEESSYLCRYEESSYLCRYLCRYEESNALQQPTRTGRAKRRHTSVSRIHPNGSRTQLKPRALMSSKSFLLIHVCLQALTRCDASSGPSILQREYSSGASSSEVPAKTVSHCHLSANHESDIDDFLQI